MLMDRPWTDLETAHGHCGHIPDALASLRDSSAETREAARWRIDNYVVLQGELYGGAPWVVRDLVKQLAMEVHPGRAIVYDLLIEFALGDAPGKVVFDGSKTVPLVGATRRELKAGRRIFEKDAMSQVPAISRHARDLLAEIDGWAVSGE